MTICVRINNFNKTQAAARIGGNRFCVAFPRQCPCCREWKDLLRVAEPSTWFVGKVALFESPQEAERVASACIRANQEFELFVADDNIVAEGEVVKADEVSSVPDDFWDSAEPDPIG